MKTWLNRLAGLLNKRRHEEEFKQELESNLQLHIEDNIRAGMSAEEARRTARLRFGSIDAASEAVRDRRGIPFIETLVRDVTYALRTLRQNRGWSAVAVLSLALGVGANSALFALINNYAFEKLPVRNPDELVVFRWYGANSVKSLTSDYAVIDKETGEPAGTALSFFTFERFRAANQTLSDIVALSPAGQLNVFTDAQAEFATGYFVSGNFFSALGISPATGRALMPADDSEAANPVVVISHPYWERKFQSDAGILGKTITINGAVFTVAGVAPADLVDITRRGSVNAPDVMIPLAFEPRIRGQGGSWLQHPQNWWLSVIGRLKPGVTAEQAQANHAGVFEQAARDGWNAFVASMPPQSRANPNLGARPVRVPQLRVVSANRGISDPDTDVFNQLAILSAICTTVLLIVCVNLANLFLSRAAGRKKEIAVRLAIGASRGRVVRQLLTESVVLSAVGGALGVLFAVWCTRLLSSVVFRIDIFSPYSYQVPRIDLTVLLFSGLLTVLTGLVFGLIPALRSTQVTSATALREGENKFSPSRSLLGRSLMVAQIALSLVLLIGAGLLMRTLWNLRQADVGFNPGNLVVFTLYPGLSGYGGPRAAALYEEIEQNILKVPGVRSLTFAAPEGLLAFGETKFDLWTTDAAGEPINFVASVMTAAPNFFETMEVPLKQGRKFTSADTQASPLVAIVSESLARTLSPDGNAIGKFFASSPQAPASRRVEIGIAADAKVNSLRDSASPLVYRPITQIPFPSRTIVVRTAVDANALLGPIAEAIRQVDPRLPIGQLSTEMDRIEGSYLMNERVFAFASTFFGGLALIIAMIGLFGLMSYSVARRTKEIGIRMALGAERRGVLRSVLTETLLLAGIGVVIGLGGALGATRFIATLLFGLAPHDPLTISVAVALMVTVSIFAGYLPARRASRVDPMVALRHE